MLLGGPRISIRIFLIPILLREALSKASWWRQTSKEIFLRALPGRLTLRQSTGMDRICLDHVLAMHTKYLGPIGWFFVAVMGCTFLGAPARCSCPLSRVLLFSPFSWFFSPAGGEEHAPF